jgi:hypothetical protein
MVRLYWVNYKANFEQLGYWFDVILLAAAAFIWAMLAADWKVAYKIDTLVYVHYLFFWEAYIVSMIVFEQFGHENNNAVSESAKKALEV